MRGLTARRRQVLGAVLGMLAATGLGAPAARTPAAGCGDVEVVFARGSAEAAGLGTVGRPLVDAVRSALPGTTVTSYAVRYAASTDQSSVGDGATDLTRHVVAAAGSCPGTLFVLGGYSQGAGVVDIAAGVGGVLGEGEVLPEPVVARVRALVVFGNPLRLAGRRLDTAPGAFRDRSLDLCASGDPVCAGGIDPLAHLRYPTDGSPVRAARFVADRIPGH